MRSSLEIESIHIGTFMIHFHGWTLMRNTNPCMVGPQWRWRKSLGFPLQRKESKFNVRFLISSSLSSKSENNQEDNIHLKFPLNFRQWNQKRTACGYFKIAAPMPMNQWWSMLPWTSLACSLSWQAAMLAASPYFLLVSQFFRMDSSRGLWWSLHDRRRRAPKGGLCSPYHFKSSPTPLPQPNYLWSLWSLSTLLYHAH